MNCELFEQMKFDEMEKMRAYLNTILYYMEKEFMDGNIEKNEYELWYDYLKEWERDINYMTDNKFNILDKQEIIRNVKNKYGKKIIETIVGMEDSGLN